MSGPLVSYALLGPTGEVIAAYDERREYYAASTIKLAVAAALLFAVDSGAVTLQQTLPSRSRFASRVPGAPAFGFDLDEIDPGMPAEGTEVSLDACLERMITVSSNEATNLLVETLGLEAVERACERLGVPGARMTRLIGDYAAREAGFTHAASALDLARLTWAVTAGDALTPDSRDRLLRLLRAQQFPMIAEALPPGTVWGSKSGWVPGIRHDVAAIGEPGDEDFRVLCICTGEGDGDGASFEAHGAQTLIRALAAAMLGTN